uniref:Uncharacterized protein n=1 Tax=Picea glauca TaxID=3330 RepID=A0A101M2L1_PICGL|nr:hypothetical protein ABT39_MTgene2991 [Picea glauca]
MRKHARLTGEGNPALISVVFSIGEASQRESVITYIRANLSPTNSSELSKLIELASSPVGREFAASPSIITYISENSLTMLIGKKVGKVR